MGFDSIEAELNHHLFRFHLGNTMALDFRETPERIIIYFSHSKMVGEHRIQEAKKGLLDICQHAADVAKKVNIDFSHVQFISSAMIADQSDAEPSLVV